MCWSEEASLVMTTIGLGGALWSKKKGHPPSTWVSLLFFTGMEFIQAMTYPVIEQCGNPLNTTLTYAGYLHIAFQNFFVQWVGLSFMPKSVRDKWFKPAMIASALTALFYVVIAFYEPLMKELCKNAWFCADQTCSIHGDWHIGWMVRLSWLQEYNFLPKVLQNIGLMLPGGSLYFITAFILPIIYGSWRWSLFHFIVGPTVAYMTTQNRFEVAAVWCLFSIGFLTAMKIPVVWDWLNTERLKEDGDES